jgi:uncharacterized protein (TIGR03083 family)
MDFAKLYRSSHDRVSERVAGLAPAQLAATVPGTPLWSVADLAAHVTGVASDALHRRLAAAGAPEWTAAQVDQRAGRPIAEVLDEWRECAAKLDPVGEPGVVRDLLIHEADLSGALGVADAPPAEAVAWVLDFALGDLGRRIDEAGLAGLRIAIDGEERIVGQTAPGRTLVAPSWELFRSQAGRRSLAQVRRYAWEGDPDPYLAVWNRYGQLPVDDIIEGPQQAPIQQTERRD